MTTASDGNANSRGGPMRRLRIDATAEGMSPSPEIPPGRSGRRVVIVGVLLVLVTWGGLYLAFRDWRARYRARALYGATQVATAIDPMAATVPAGVTPEAWRDAVSETHAMLVTVTASNLLDMAALRSLRGEVAARVARARPETALSELAGLWDDLHARAGPLLDRHPRPALLLNPLPAGEGARRAGEGARH
jgi:hypothetical protein